MSFSKGIPNITLQDILNKVSEAQILAFYLNIFVVPKRMHSPFRKDLRPSFGIYSSNGKRIYYKDFGTNETGSLFDLLGRLWGITSFREVIERIYFDIPKMTESAEIKECTPIIVSRKDYSKNCDIKCKIREWKDYDLEYWENYGISLEWLKYADVYPISHKIIIKDGKEFIFGADKYAYAYLEHKEGKETIKIYQPFNKNGFKWASKHDKSVISLWTKLPQKGNIVCVCSSLKDALCLWANTKIPAIAIQGEGYNMSKTAVLELKRRFKHVCIMLDNDEVGLYDAKKLAENTGFTNVVLPFFNEGKDISDLMLSLEADKEKFKSIIIPLFKQAIN